MNLVKQRVYMNKLKQPTINTDLKGPETEDRNGVQENKKKKGLIIRFVMGGLYLIPPVSFTGEEC